MKVGTLFVLLLSVIGYMNFTHSITHTQEAPSHIILNIKRSNSAMAQSVIDAIFCASMYHIIIGQDLN